MTQTIAARMFFATCDPEALSQGGSSGCHFSDGAVPTSARLVDALTFWVPGHGHATEMLAFWAVVVAVLAVTVRRVIAQVLRNARQVSS